MASNEKLGIHLNIDSYYHKRLKINLKKKNDKRNKPFFSNIKMELENHKISCLLGISGIGKTTLLRILLSDSVGTFYGVCNYYVNDQKVDISILRNNGCLGYLSQETTLIPWKKVIQNICLPSELNKKLDKPNNDEIENIFNSLNLDLSIKELYPFKLSFGTRQRVALARILLYKPKFLMIDELFTGLDTATSELIEEYLKRFVINNKSLCFFVTHDVEKAVRLEAKVQILRHDRTLLSLNEKETESDYIKSLLHEDITKIE